MTDEHAERPADAEHPLDAVARLHNDPDLFPDEVRALYDAGKARQARKVLLRHAREERDETRAALQEEVADHPRLWLDPVSKPPRMFTLNGIGTRLYGKSQPAGDGTYIATLWLVLLFVPLWPLGSYLVAPASSGGWFFLAKAPFTRLALGVRRVAALAVIAIALRLVVGAYWSGTHASLIVYNGFERPVSVTVANDRGEVPPGEHIVFDDVKLESTSLEARWSREDAPFESLHFDFAGHADHDVIYNVANRGALRVDYILYGGGMPPEGRWLEGGPVSVLPERIDYSFVEPPESTRVADGSTVQRSVLYDATAGYPVTDAVGALLQTGHDDQAMQVARAALMADPTNATLALMTAQNLLAGDLAAQLELFRGLIERSPVTVDLHRYYQSLWPEAQHEEVKAEYAALLAEHPSDPMYHYLVGRLEEPGSQSGVTHYNDALALDPDYPPVHRALAYNAVQERAWVRALQHYEQYAAVDPGGGADVIGERARLSRRLGTPISEIVAMFTEASDQGGAFYATIMHLRVAGDPAAHADAAQSLYRQLGASTGQQPPVSLRLNLQADAAITAGALNDARASLRQIDDPAERDPNIVLRLVLSSGGTPEDELLLSGIPDWYDRLHLPNRFAALALLDTEGRSRATEEFHGELREVVDMLQSPSRLRNVDRMTEATRDLGMQLRIAAYFAASRVLRSVPGSQTARRFYEEEAYAMSLPGELPFQGR